MGYRSHGDNKTHIGHGFAHARDITWSSVRWRGRTRENEEAKKTKRIERQFRARALLYLVRPRRRVRFALSSRVSRHERRVHSSWPVSPWSSPSRSDRRLRDRNRWISRHLWLNFHSRAFTSDIKGSYHSSNIEISMKLMEFLQDKLTLLCDSSSFIRSEKGNLF